MAAKKDNTLNIIGLMLGLLFILRNLKLFGAGNRLFGSTVENLDQVKGLLATADQTGEIVEAKARGLLLFLDPNQVFYRFEVIKSAGQVKRGELKALQGSGELFQIEKITAGQNGVAIVEGQTINVVEPAGPGYGVAAAYALEPNQVAFIRSVNGL